jgi:hypothetical protein
LTWWANIKGLEGDKKNGLYDVEKMGKKNSAEAR